jgi:uncharacterized protein (DUF305 family)
MDHGAEGAPVTIPAGALYTEADVRFMQGMIAHHAQAIHMSRMARARGEPAAGALRPEDRPVAGGRDRADAGVAARQRQFAPDTSAWRTMTMHGMLTAAELAALEAARGPAFDRLFLAA